MPDYVVTIPNPVLLPMQKFKTRYRLVGGAYTANVDRTNSPFTLTGLAEGTYEMEIIFVDENGIECAAIVKTFEVVEPPVGFTCPSFSYEIVEYTGNYFVVITYPTPVTVNPQCGWEVWVTQQSLTKIPYTTLPATGQIAVPIPANKLTQLVIQAKLCNGNTLWCVEEDLPPIEPTECEGITITGVTLSNTVPGQNTWTLNFVVTTGANGGPCTVNYSETSPYIPPGSGINGVFTPNIAAGLTNSVIALGPISPTGALYQCIVLQGTLIDFCGNVKPFCISANVGDLPCSCSS